MGVIDSDAGTGHVKREWRSWHVRNDHVEDGGHTPVEAHRRVGACGNRQQPRWSCLRNRLNAPCGERLLHFLVLGATWMA